MRPLIDMARPPRRAHHRHRVTNSARVTNVTKVMTASWASFPPRSDLVPCTSRRRGGTQYDETSHRPWSCLRQPKVCGAVPTAAHPSLTPNPCIAAHWHSSRRGVGWKPRRLRIEGEERGRQKPPKGGRGQRFPFLSGECGRENAREERGSEWGGEVDCFLPPVLLPPRRAFPSAPLPPPRPFPSSSPAPPASFLIRLMELGMTRPPLTSSSSCHAFLLLLLLLFLRGA